MEKEKTEEMLTIEEFSKRMGISRTTTFTWIKNKKLIQGKHYIKINRVLRINWKRAVEQLLEDNIDETPPPLPEPKQHKPVTPKLIKKQQNNQSAINWDY